MNGRWPAGESSPEAAEPALAAEPEGVAEPAAPPSRRPAPILASLFVVAGAAWVALLAWGLIAAAQARGGIAPLTLAAWTGLGSAPLALLAILYVLLVRTGRVEAAGYTRASAQLRADSEALATMLALLTERMDQAHAALAGQSGQLETLGATAAERMTRAAGELAGQASAFGAVAASLDDATAIARADLGVLLGDIPHAEAVVRAMAEALREGSNEAEVRAMALSTLLGEIETRARAASEASGGAAARLAGQLDRIEASAAAADRRMEEVAIAIGRTIDAALEAAAEGIEDTRRAVMGQSAALTAMVEQGQASLGSAGEDAIRVLSERLDALIGRIDGIGSGLRGQELVMRGLLGQLEHALAAVEARFAALGDAGAEHTADLAEAIVALSAHADAVGRTLGSSTQSADALVGRVAQLREQAEASSTTICETIPAALSRIRLHAENSLQAITSAGTRVERLHDATEIVSTRLGEADVLVERQRGALEAAGTQADARLSGLHAQTEALEALLARTEGELRSLSEGASGQLVDALLRVRETATQASEHARDALSSAIPRAAQRLGEAASKAMSAALADAGRAEIAAVGLASEQAVEAARLAAEKLTRQLLTIAETSTAIEARIEENRSETEAHDDAAFARQVSLLIEALNSTAIDLARLFAAEVSDESWRAYLKGDRGIFTRRAVRLLDRQEAGAIAARHGEDEAFRDQVNRYIHDFETLLRRVMATPDGTPIATTMLSSDTGKLYVALAQAIERLRR